MIFKKKMCCSLTAGWWSHAKIMAEGPTGLFIDETSKAKAEGFLVALRKANEELKELEAHENSAMESEEVSRRQRKLACRRSTVFILCNNGRCHAGASEINVRTCHQSDWESAGTKNHLQLEDCLWLEQMLGSYLAYVTSGQDMTQEGFRINFSAVVTFSSPGSGGDEPIGLISFFRQRKTLFSHSVHQYFNTLSFQLDAYPKSSNELPPQKPRCVSYRSHTQRDFCVEKCFMPGKVMRF